LHADTYLVSEIMHIYYTLEVIIRPVKDSKRRRKV